MKWIRFFVLGLAASSLTACQSLYYSGMTRVQWEPMQIDGRQICCKGSYISGKEYQDLDVTVKKTGNDLDVRIHAGDVRNVETLKASGDTVGKITEGVTEGVVQGLKTLP